MSVSHRSNAQSCLTSLSEPMVGALPHPLSNIIELILHSLTPLTGAITVTAEWKGPTQSGSITCTVALRTMIDLLIAMDTDIEVGAVS